MKTSNVQLRKLSRARHPTFDAQWRKRTRRILVVALSIFLLPAARAADSPELAEAMKPLMAGVPEVAVARLQTLLKNNRSDDEWRATAEKLAFVSMQFLVPGKCCGRSSGGRKRCKNFSFSFATNNGGPKRSSDRLSCTLTRATP